MTNKVTVTDSVQLDVPAEQALAVLWEVKNLSLYEPKVDAMRVEPETPERGIYAIQGRFAGVPWRGIFSYVLNPRGFHSELLNGPLNVRMNGGFVVTSKRSEQCLITHYERYQFSSWLALLAPLIRLYLTWAVKKELRGLAGIICGKAPLDPGRWLWVLALRGCIRRRKVRIGARCKERVSYNHTLEGGKNHDCTT